MRMNNYTYLAWSAISLTVQDGKILHGYLCSKNTHISGNGVIMRGNLGQDRNMQLEGSNAAQGPRGLRVPLEPKRCIYPS